METKVEMDSAKKKKFHRKMNELESAVEGYRSYEMANLLVELLGMEHKSPGSSPISQDRMRIRITREKALEHSSQHYSRWSTFQVKQWLRGSIIPVLVGYSEPEVLLECFMCETVLKKITTSGLLMAGVVELEHSMKSWEIQAQEISLQVVEELVGHWHAKTG